MVFLKFLWGAKIPNSRHKHLGMPRPAAPLLCFIIITGAIIIAEVIIICQAIIVAGSKKKGPPRGATRESFPV